jgi:hypothetical protein
MNFLLLIIQKNLEQYTEKLSISVELHKWNTRIKIEYIYKKEFDEKFGKINVIQISSFIVFHIFNPARDCAESFLPCVRCNEDQR